MATIRDAYLFAEEAHSGQGYGTYSYMYHLEAVYKKTKQLFETDPVMLKVSYLHDTLEDTDTTYEQLRSKFGQEVADAVVVLTKTKDMTRKQYLQRFEKESLPWKVKVADCLCNLEESVKISDARRIERYTDTLNVLFGGEV